MHSYRSSSYSTTQFGYFMTSTVKQLIIANVAVFLLIKLASGFPWLSLFGLVPALLFGGFRLWQPVTYMFLHGGPWHLAVNMLMLWFFGPALERAWGRKQFLVFYLFCGIGGGLCSWLFGLGSFVPVIGASGAIFGLLVAYAMMYPDTTILMFFIFPMKIRHAVLFMAGFNLLGAFSASNTGIAYFGHLGGALFGYLYLKNEWIRRQLAFAKGVSAAPVKKTKRVRPKKIEPDPNQQIDAILDKISRHGIGSLSRKERVILESRSKGK